MCKPLAWFAQLQRGGTEGPLCLGGNPGRQPRSFPKTGGQEVGRSSLSTRALLQGLSIAALCLLVRGIIFEPSSNLVTLLTGSQSLPSKIRLWLSPNYRFQSALLLPSPFPHTPLWLRESSCLGRGCVISPHSFYKVHTPDFSTLPTLSLAKKR